MRLNLLIASDDRVPHAFICVDRQLSLGSLIDQLPVKRVDHLKLIKVSLMLQDIDTIPFGFAGLVVVLQATPVCRSRRLGLLLRHQERCLLEELSHAHFLFFRTHLAHLVCLVRFFSSLEHLFLDLALHQLICAALDRRLVLLFILQAVTNLFHPLC